MPQLTCPGLRVVCLSSPCWVVSAGLAGMLQLQRYAQYVDDQAMAKEEVPGCESCTANRMMLEKVRIWVGWAGGGGEGGGGGGSNSKRRLHQERQAVSAAGAVSTQVVSGCPPPTHTHTHTHTHAHISYSSLSFYTHLAHTVIQAHLAVECGSCAESFTGQALV